MSRLSSVRQSSLLLPGLASVVFAVLGLVYFAGNYKTLTLLAGLAGILLLLYRDLAPLRAWPALLLLGYVAVSGLTRFWAISGKFFLEAFSEIFVAAVLFLWVMTAREFSRRTVRRVMLTVTGVSTLYALLSVEAASTGLTKAVLGAVLPAMGGTTMGFEAGTRLTGILGNANILSSVVALGIFFSICLLCGEEEPKLRPVWAGVLAVNAFAFLLMFSMGAMACFAVAVIAYLIFAGEQRGSALIRMLSCAVPTLLWVFLAFPFFNRTGAAVCVPLLALAGNTVSAVLLERLAAPRLTAVMEKRSGLALVVLAGVIVLAGVYLLLGYNLSGPYTFGGQLERSAYPEAGEHVLSVQATGEVTVKVISQDMSQVMMHTNSVLYQGPADGAAFTVPEGSEVCYFTFTAAEGTVLDQAQLDGETSIRLKYTLLPGFIANRLQGLWANQNAIQRTVFFRDGMKMFAQSPLLGNGVGSFETGLTSVQDFYYETKYIHNHYIQILLEAGILGFVPFAGALAGMFWLLLRRRKDADWPFRAEYPALWAALVMTACHMGVEVSMSIINFICCAFVTFALVIRCCAPQRPAPEPEPVSKKRRAAPKKKDWRPRLAWAALPAVFTVSLALNMAAVGIARSASYSTGEFLQHLELTAMLDPYEGNDAKITYVNTTYKNQINYCIPQANAYASQLLDQHSNAIPWMLLQYFLGTEQYDQAIRAAKASAEYSASDPETWNGVCATLRSVMVSGIFSPLVTEEDPGVLLDGMLEYYDMLCQRNRRSMEHIRLDAANQDFFSKMIAAADTGRTTGEILDVIAHQVFDSAHGCDADGDGVHDQIAGRQGAQFASGGGISLEAGGWIDLNLYDSGFSGVIRAVVRCENPAAVSAASSGTALAAEVSDGQASFVLPMAGQGSTVPLRISAAGQTEISEIQIYAEAE